nr:CG12133-PA [Drosophila erecta]
MLNSARELVYNVHVCCPKDLPDSSVCGQSPPIFYIVGGKDAQLNQFPWTALLLYKRDIARPWTTSPRCAGSLITNRYVLTAAHCLTVTRFTEIGVRLGEHNLETNPDCIWLLKKKCAKPHVDIDVSLAIVHKQYHTRDGRHYNDIALLRLARPVIYTAGIKPICIRPDFEIARSSFENHTLEIAGWGDSSRQQYSSVLLHGTIRGMSPENCLTQFPTLRVDRDIQICAMGRDGTDTGRGDSGGPLMASVGRADHQFYYLAGITSYGGDASSYGCGPAVYTKTSSYIWWIKWNMMNIWKKSFM